VPASVSREAAKRLGKSRAVVDYNEFAGRRHFTAGAPGRETVADCALEWANCHTGPGQDGGAGEGLTLAVSDGPRAVARGAQLDPEMPPKRMRAPEARLAASCRTQPGCSAR
jgi:hypothetical protein